MKIAHIFHELKYSGAEIMYVDAAKEFQQKGCVLYAVNTSRNLGEFAPEFKAAGFHVFFKPMLYGNLIYRVLYLIRFCVFLVKEDVDVVHIHCSRVRFQMSLCAFLLRKKSVFTFHNVFDSNWYSYHYHILHRWICKNILKTRFQTISDSVYTNELIKYRNKTNLVYNWYGSNRFFPGKECEKEEIRKSLNISPYDLVVISVGGCSPVKRHSDIIRAIPLIIREHKNFKYLHLGTGESLQEEIELSKELKVDDFILFCGNQKDVRKYLVASDIYCMPSKFEGISITTIEALGCNIPSVLYNVPGLKDFNSEVKSCILIEENYEVLAKTIISLFNDKKKQSELVTNAKIYVDLKFNLQKNAERIFELYL